MLGRFPNFCTNFKNITEFEYFNILFYKYTNGIEMIVFNVHAKTLLSKHWQIEEKIQYVESSDH